MPVPVASVAAAARQLVPMVEAAVGVAAPRSCRSAPPRSSWPVVVEEDSEEASSALMVAMPASSARTARPVRPTAVGPPVVAVGGAVVRAATEAAMAVAVVAVVCMPEASVGYSTLVGALSTQAVPVAQAMGTGAVAVASERVRPEESGARVEPGATALAPVASR
jgi:hypothetical protein